MWVLSSLLLDNERWKQAEVPAEFQDLVNSIADGRITLPERKSQGNIPFEHKMNTCHLRVDLDIGRLECLFHQAGGQFAGLYSVSITFANNNSQKSSMSAVRVRKMLQ